MSSSPPSTVKSAQAQAASLTFRRPPGHPELVAAQRNLAVLNIEKAIRRALAGKPPLTGEQVARITDLLAVA